MHNQSPRVVQVKGAMTSYIELGDPEGDLLFLVHGFRGDHHGLLKIAAGLKRFRVIIPDLPGFGDSTRLGSTHNLENLGEWLKDFINHFKSPNFYLLGHSFGTLVVSNSIKQGVKPKHLILINPISSPALEGPKRLLTLGAIVYYKLGEILPEKFADLLLKSPLIVRLMSEVMAKTKDRNLRHWIHAQHHAYFSNFSDRKALSQTFKASVSHTVTEYAEILPAQTLLLVGEKDDITPLVQQLNLHKLIQNSKLIIIPETGHLIHYEADEIASENITNFLSIKLTTK